MSTLLTDSVGSHQRVPLAGRYGHSGLKPCRAVPELSLLLVRAAFGLIAAASALRLLAHGWVDRLWIEPTFLLRYDLFAPPVLPGGALHVLVGVLAALGVVVAVGGRIHRLLPRVAAGLWTLGFAYTELLDQTTYLNHYWAMTLLGVLFTLMPLGRAAIGIHWLWILRGQVAAVYFFAGLAKLDPDWLVRGEPLTGWLLARADTPLIGRLVALPAFGLGLSWGAVLFDLTIVGWLAWRRTRLAALAVVVVFHLATAVLFPTIGVFPYFMIGLSLVWLDSDDIADVVTRIRRGPLGQHLPSARPAKLAPAVATPRRVGVTVFMGLWLILQILLPLRHLAIPGDVRWTEEGGLLAWRVMAEEKVGWTVYGVTRADGTTTDVPITDVLTANQAHTASTRPDLLVRTARHLAEVHAVGDQPAEVRAMTTVTWNGRPGAPLIDPHVDLAGDLEGRQWVAPAPQ